MTFTIVLHEHFNTGLTLYDKNPANQQIERSGKIYIVGTTPLRRKY